MHTYHKKITTLIFICALALPVLSCADTEHFQLLHSLHNIRDAQITEINNPNPSILRPVDLDSALSKSLITLPDGMANATEASHVVHYLGTGKSIEGQPRRQVPMRSYYAACATDTAEPRMFVSLTRHDTRPEANPDHPRIGSIFEVKYDTQTGTFAATNNHTLLPFCNETHGITVSGDCSKVAVLCATTIEQHVSETYDGPFVDLVASAQNDTTHINHTDNEDIINAIPGLTPEERQARYQYNGEMWLLEWSNSASLTSNPQKFVIHKAYGGGNPWGAPSLVYSESDNSYAATFPASVFDSNHGGRHWSAALMIIERDDWKLNPDDRGWGWLCGDGHVFNISAFWNPFITRDRNGEYGSICTTDGNKYQGRQAGSIAIKYEGSNSFQGSINYLIESSNGAVTNGGGHHAIALNENFGMGVITAREMEPLHHPDYQAYIQEAEQAAIEFFGASVAQTMGYVGLGACNWWSKGPCLFEFMRYEFSGVFPLFTWGFWSKNLQDFVSSDLSKVGIFHFETDSSIARNIPQRDGSMTKWLAGDDDCMYGAPQLVDLNNGRFLLGYGKYQCISDGNHLRRFATGANGTNSVSTLVPKQYFLMEIDIKGNPLSDPVVVSNSGWGSLDHLIPLGKGKAAWAYIPSPQLDGNGNQPNPENDQWEFMIYTSPEWLDTLFEDGFEAP